MAYNPYQDAARRAKANRIAESLVQAGITAAIMASANDAQWALACEAALPRHRNGKPAKSASGETRALVIERMLQFERTRPVRREFSESELFGQMEA